jgi:hypothetical protein
MEQRSILTEVEYEQIASNMSKGIAFFNLIIPLPAKISKNGLQK